MQEQKTKTSPGPSKGGEGVAGHFFGTGRVEQGCGKGGARALKICSGNF